MQGAAPKYPYLTGIAGAEVGLPRFVRLGRRIGPLERLPRGLGDEGDRSDLEIDDLDRLGLCHVAVAPPMRLVKPRYQIGHVLPPAQARDRKSTRLNSSHVRISYA